MRLISSAPWPFWFFLTNTGSKAGSIKITPRPGGFLRGQLDITAACGRRIATDSSLQALVNDVPTYLETFPSHHGAERMIMMREAKGVRNRHPSMKSLVLRWILNGGFCQVPVGFPLSSRLEFPNSTAVTPYGSYSHLFATASD